MTVYKSPHSQPLLSKKGKQNKNCLLRNNQSHNQASFPKCRKLSIILDHDGKPASIIDSDEEGNENSKKRPPSFDYDLDA